MNTARGIAYQVSSVISGFVANFQMALNPQIIKRYASGEIESMILLVFRGAKYSLFLLMVMVVPFYIRAPYVLQLWLGNVPEYTVTFLRLTLIMAMVDSMAGPLVTAMQATGRIRIFQLVISVIMLANLPLSYFFLSLGCKPYVVMYVAIATSLVGLISRLCILKTLISSFNFFEFIKDILLRNIAVCILSISLPVFFSSCFNDDLIGLLIVCFCSVLYSLFVVYFVGLKKVERVALIKKVKLILKK